MDDLRLDLRQALRSFVKNPAFSVVVDEGGALYTGLSQALTTV